MSLAEAEARTEGKDQNSSDPMFHPPEKKDLEEILELGTSVSELSMNPALAKSLGLSFVSTLREKCKDPTFVNKLASVAKSYFGGPECAVFMMILSLLAPKTCDIMRKHSSIPTRFKTPQEVLLFVTALIETGVASQTERSIVFVMGNTGHSGTILKILFLPSNMWIE